MKVKQIRSSTCTAPLAMRRSDLLDSSSWLETEKEMLSLSGALCEVFATGVAAAWVALVACWSMPLARRKAWRPRYSHTTTNSSGRSDLSAMPHISRAPMAQAAAPTAKPRRLVGSERP